MSPTQTYLIHSDEISLKGKNRHRFIRTLIENISSKLPQSTTKPLQGRLLLTSTKKPATINHALSTTFGIANFINCQTCPTKPPAINHAALEIVKPLKGNTFAIKCRRIDKHLPFKSQDINIKLGDFIRQNTSLTVNLDKPQITLYIYADTKTTYIGTHLNQGLKGLPNGASSPLISLISGGIDSPVAAYKMLSRGTPIIYLHTHSYPQTNRQSIHKVQSIVKLLKPYQTKNQLILTPILTLQKALYQSCDPKFLMLLYRRAMLRIATDFTLKHNALGIITGDSLGQVASQTLENLSVQNQATHLPIFRPLIGNSKHQIIKLARLINTYKTSIQPHQDCCTLFVPKRPKTKAKPKDLIQQESQVKDYLQLIKSAISQSKTVSI